MDMIGFGAGGQTGNSGGVNRRNRQRQREPSESEENVSDHEALEMEPLHFGEDSEEGLLLLDERKHKEVCGVVLLLWDGA